MARTDSLSAELLESVEDDGAWAANEVFPEQKTQRMHIIDDDDQAELAAVHSNVDPDLGNANTQSDALLDEEAYMNHLSALLVEGQEAEFMDQLRRRPPKNLSANAGGITLLQLASRDGHASAAASLLAVGAEPNHRINSEVSPPLILAASGHNWATLAILLRLAGPNLDVNVVDAKGDTALHHAARAGRIEAVVQLLRRGADTRCSNVLGLTPIGPEEARELLDLCVTSNVTGAEADEFEIVFDYRLLAPGLPAYDGMESPGERPRLSRYQLLGEMNILLQLTEFDVMSPLLNHPVVVSFLGFKWKRLKKLVYVALMVKLVYVLLINALVVCRGLDIESVASQTSVNNANKWNNTVKMNHSNDLRSCEWLSIVILPYAVLLSYLGRNDLLMFGALLISTISTLMIALSVQELTFISLAIISSCVVMLIEFHRTPAFTYSIQLLKFVLRKYITFLTPFVVIILSLGIGLHLILISTRAKTARRNNESWMTSIMETIFILSNSNFTNHASNLILILYVLGLVCGSVILLNILTGLAVSDMQRIDKIANELHLLSKARKANRVEDFCVRLHNVLIRRRYVPRFFLLFLRRVLLFPSPLTERAARASLRCSSKVQLAEGGMLYALSQDVLIRAGQIVRDRFMASCSRRHLDPAVMPHVQETFRDTLQSLDEKIQERLRSLEIKLGMFSHQQAVYLEEVLRCVDSKLDSIRILLDRRLPSEF